MEAVSARSIAQENLHSLTPLKSLCLFWHTS